MYVTSGLLPVNPLILDLGSVNQERTGHDFTEQEEDTFCGVFHPLAGEYIV